MIELVKLKRRVKRIIMKTIVGGGVAVLVVAGSAIVCNMSSSGTHGTNLFFGIVTLAVIAALSYMGLQYLVSSGSEQ